jgi:hypothetical protein
VSVLIQCHTENNSLVILFYIVQKGTSFVTIQSQGLIIIFSKFCSQTNQSSNCGQWCTREEDHM